ncbi:MAG: SIMPL domain-containing protein [Bacteroidales bacterium]|nr:SIMPL domain-containing protein [Bacteroidales bacterium]
MKKALIIGAAMVIAAAMLPLSVAKLKSYDRTVDVKGLCEKEVKADKVIWPITYKEMSDDLSALLKQTDANNARIVEFLKSGGLNDSEITVGTPKVSDKFASEYGNNDRLFRYLSTNVVTVCTSNVDAVLALQARQSELMKKGLTLSENDWENPLQFKFEALNDIKPEMIEEATANAREAAEKFAKDSGSRIGKIKTATQGTFSIENRDSNTPHLKRVRVVTYVTYYLRH